MDPFPKWQTTPKTHLKEKYPLECRLLLDGILIGFRLLTAFRQVFHGSLPVPISFLGERGIVRVKYLKEKNREKMTQPKLKPRPPS